MVQQNNYSDAIKKYKPEAFMFGGGGNDLLGEGRLVSVLNQYSTGNSAQQVVKTQKLEKIVSKLGQYYRQIITSSLQLQPDLKIFIHGYDNSIPQKGGKWLGKPFASKGIPLNIGSEVIKIIIGQFNQELAEIEAQFSNSVTYLNLLGQVGKGPSSWHDELHPKNPGFKRAAKFFINELNGIKPRLPDASESLSLNLHADQSITAPMAAASDNEATITKITRFIRNSHSQPFGGQNNKITPNILPPKIDPELEKSWEDIDRLIDEIHKPDTADRRSNREGYSLYAGRSYNERTIGKNNFDEFYVLSKGHKVGKSVGRIQITVSGGGVTGYGTGFLVGPNLLLTNNHVISQRHKAAICTVVFDYELDTDGSSRVPHYFRITDEVFLTSEKLDYTFMSLEPLSKTGVELSEFSSIPLLPKSGKALKQERVSIIQHPFGDYKKVALRDNFVLGVADEFMYYVTDTEPGSSGSPVFNLEWQVAALHHRTVPDKQNPEEFLANRGVRISSILANVQSRMNDGERDAFSVQRLIEIGRTTSNEISSLMPNFKPSSHIPETSADGNLPHHVKISTANNDPANVTLHDGIYAGMTIREAAASLAYRWQTELEQDGSNELFESSTSWSASSARAVISDRGFNEIIEHEVGGWAYYKQILKSRATWPTGQSGVTIGVGYDIGYHSYAELKSNWGAYLSSSELARLSAAVGIKGKAAKSLIPSLRDIHFSQEAASIVFEKNTLPKYVGITYRNLPDSALEELHPHCISALVSLVFNRGASFRKQGDRYTEMRNILRLLKDGNYNQIPNQFRLMKRIWAGENLNGLLLRRDSEANLFQAGLNAMAQEADFSGNFDCSPIIDDDHHYEDLDIDNTIEQDHLDEIHVSNAETLVRLNQADARWVNSLINNPDTWHLAEEHADDVFEFNADVIKGLIHVGQFVPVIGNHNKLIISLRGCSMVNTTNYMENIKSISLRPQNPNHHSFKCLIGVYDQQTELITLYRASTVPRRSGMLNYYNKVNFNESGRNCNLLPTGCYEYCVGTHYGSNGRNISGVLRLGSGPDPDKSGPATVLRTKNDLVYGTRDLWDKTKPSDNIHPAFSDVTFSSLGCLTIRGSQRANQSYKTSTLEWERFQHTGGFAGQNYAKRYDNMLVSGHEAACVAAQLNNSKNLDNLICLKHGSQGDIVRNLQQQLNILVDGDFGAVTKFELANQQKHKLGYATGSFNAKMAELLGMSFTKQSNNLH